VESQVSEGLYETVQIFGLISKGSKNVVIESTENRRFRPPHCCLTPLTLPETGVPKLHVVADHMGLSLFTFVWWATKNTYYAKECVLAFKAVQGH